MLGQPAAELGEQGRFAGREIDKLARIAAQIVELGRPAVEPSTCAA